MVTQQVQVTFTSVWAEGIVSTKATLNLANGEVSNIDSVDVGEDYEHLEDEYITLPQSEQKFAVEMDEEDGSYKLVEQQDLAICRSLS